MSNINKQGMTKLRSWLKDKTIIDVDYDHKRQLLVFEFEGGEYLLVVTTMFAQGFPEEGSGKL